MAKSATVADLKASATDTATDEDNVDPAMPRDPTLAAAVAMFNLASDPTRAGILLELGEGPRGTTALVVAIGRHQNQVSHDLTKLRLAGLVESNRAGNRRVHALTPAGRTLAEALRKLSG
jgi:DNA-binding transcriptional ArsR family regulator